MAVFFCFKSRKSPSRRLYFAQIVTLQAFAPSSARSVPSFRLFEFVQAEEAIQRQVNELGREATRKKLKTFDTDGSPIMIGAKKYTSKGKTLKHYETLHGLRLTEGRWKSFWRKIDQYGFYKN